MFVGHNIKLELPIIIEVSKSTFGSSFVLFNTYEGWYFLLQLND